MNYNDTGSKGIIGNTAIVILTVLFSLGIAALIVFSYI